MKLLALLLALVALPADAQRCPVWDTVYYNGSILTGIGLLSATPERVKSIAIQDGKIVAVDPTDSLSGCARENIDLHGAFAMPGFNDAHTHIAFAGQQRLAVDLDNVPSLADMLARIKAYAATLGPGQWILGGGWDQTKWPDKTLPTRQDLDAVSAGHPALLSRTDLHIAIANSAALAAASITAATVAPTGSAIDHDASGQPTGIVRETPARALIEKQIPPPDAATRRKALQLSIDDALAHGVTSLQDFSTIDDFRVMMAMEDEGKLPIRISEWIPFDLPIATIKKYQALRPATDPYLHTGMLKGFMDGSLGSRTAAMVAPYSDDPTNSGLALYDQKKLDAMTRERAEAGFQMGFHAIGDKANSMALDAFGFADFEPFLACREARSGPISPNSKCVRSVVERQRNRIEHAQVLAAKNFDSFAMLGIIASMQPSHLLTDMAWAGARLGPERSKYAYAWRSMLDHHVPLAFGTDYPVESINPMRGLYAAVTRMNVEGTQTFEPQEKISIGEAIYAYTQGSAYAQFDETNKGLLEPGFFADMVVLDRDITKASPQEILHTRVLRTVVGGVTRFVGAAGAAETLHKPVADND